MAGGARRGGRRAAGGQGAVEFALVSLALFLIIFGTIDVGRGVFLRSLLANAVREAARDGSIYPSDGSSYPNIAGAGGLVEAAQRRSPALPLAAGDFTVQCALPATPGSFSAGTCAGGTAVIGGLLQVCATYTYRGAFSQLLPLPPVVMSEGSRIAIH